MNVISDGRWKLYLDGLWVTLKVSFWAIVFGTLLGMILAVLRLPEVTEYNYRGNNPVKKAGVAVLRFFSGFAKFYIDVIRGTPLLLQVLIINFGIFIYYSRWSSFFELSKSFIIFHSTRSNSDNFLIIIIVNSIFNIKNYIPNYYL